MVVILIVNSPSAEPPYLRGGGELNARGEQLSTSTNNTNTTSISFVSSSSSSQVDPENSYATTKEEEWVTKKKVELTTKRQIETRVKRQVVLEDGKVVEDSGPIVTTNTTEDTEKQESKQTEHRNLGEDLPDGGEGWVAVPGQGGLVKEVNEKTTKTREEKEERLETEDIHHLGDISDEAYLTAVQRQSQEGGGLRAQELVPHDASAAGRPRVVHQSSKSRKVVDTQDARHLSELQPDGRVVTETKRTTDHEEVNHVEEPDAEGGGSDGEEETHKRSSQQFTKSKDQEFVEYLADGKRIGGEMRYEAETAQGDRQGDPSLLEWDSLSARARRMRRTKGLTGTTPDRKDALTKRPLNFDQEEETRKAETSKWLEHHFGSESRSSKDSIGDEDELPPSGTTSSFINVTMKSTKNGVNGTASPVERVAPTASRVFMSSPETDSPSPTSYFQGISEWKAGDRPERPARTSFSAQTSAFKDRVQVLPTGPNHTFAPPKSSPSPPYQTSSLGSKNLRDSQGSNLNGRASSGPESSLGGRYYQPSSASPVPPPVNGHAPPRHDQPAGDEPLMRSSAASPRHHRRLNGHAHAQRDDREERSRVVHREYHQHLEEPAPDYPRATPTPSPPPPPPLVDTKKKVYQRTRFAADIPPARVKATQTAHKPTLGESFRKFVGKFRSSSKEKRRGKKGSRSPSPQAPTYQQYDGVDVEGEGEGEGEPVAPPRSRYQAAMRRAGTDRDPVVTRYYLGEDPFGGSIYGREREYDGATPFRRKHRRSDEEERNARNQQLTNGGSSSTLGRFSKSTSRLVNERHTNGHQDRGGVQTLPRKLHDDRPKKQVYVTRSNVERVTTSSPSWERQQYSRLNGNHPNSHSMINVSVVNQASPVGPAKPARTYRSLLRSKSFNVHAGDGLADHLNGGVHKSNPQLHRLDESPPPLKSPGIVTSISRSTKDLSRAVDDDYERTAFDFDRKPYVNGNSRTVHETKKKIFMKNLQDRAPELFRTLHGAEEERRPSPVDERPGRLYTSTPLRNGHRVLEYSGSYRSSGTSSPLDRVHSPTYSTSVTHSPTVRNGSGEVVNRSVVRRGSGDDYSETVHITSKSEDPLRPSVTDTVQSFTKKTLPGKGGRSKGTIESSETKTVTKSRYRGGERDLKYIEGSKYAPRNGGVTIEVRNNKLF